MPGKPYSNLLLCLSRIPAATRKLSSSSSGAGEPVPVLYSFLRPTLFSRTTYPSPPPPAPPPPPHHHQRSLAPDAAAALHSTLLSSIRASDTDEAWRSFRALAAASFFPPPDVSHALISHLSSRPDLHNLKRAFASAVFLLDRCPHSLPLHTLNTLFSALDTAGALAPALALVRAMFKNRVFPPFSVWGEAVISISRRIGGVSALRSFLEVFEENCRIAAEEGARSMVPDLRAFNVAMDVCCRELGSVSGSTKVIETMSTLGAVQDMETFGAMAYLFAWKGLESRILELQELVSSLGFADNAYKRNVIRENLIGGYVKSGNMKSISVVMLRALSEEGGAKEGKDWKGFGEETYAKVVRCFIENGSVKELAGLIADSQELESALSMPGIECSVGFGIVNACVSLGMLDKAHTIMDEMHARGASVGIGVYSSILKAYCRERRTAEAAQLVTQIRDAGLKLDSGSYESLIDASMTVQDFQSAFSLFRGMREANLPELKMSYLTIMTGLMENHRPELMAGFLDSVVYDPRVEVATHDWNSIIHSFCKVGRLEDARRTYRRMLFLQFEPNEQTYLSLINGYVSAEKYFSVLILWTDVKKKKSVKFDNALVDALLYALVKGGFFDASMEVVEKAHELKIFIDKWRYKQAFMETHKKLKVAKMKRKNMKKTEALVAFKNWAGLNA